jgi:tRNA dimethylallyltransferase
VPRQPPLIVVCGPTATGKTALSVALARSLPGAEIVSADSRQVYRGMDIGTAKATAAERAAVPHHGLDLAEPDEPVTVADWAVHANEALGAIASRGGAALLVGGTGLYLRAVTRGLPLSDTGHDPALRARLEDRLAREGLETLAAELVSASPAARHAFDLRNPRRVVRALERAALGGDPFPPPPRGYPAPALWLGVAIDPVELRARIASRVHAQFAGGLLEEAASLRARFGEGPAPFSAMGYREAFDVLAGRRPLDEAVGITIGRSNAYARRQRTWFRSEPGLTWLSPGAGLERAAREIVVRFLDQAAALTPEPR